MGGMTGSAQNSDQQRRAVNTAVNVLSFAWSVLRLLDDFNATHPSLPPISFRIGLHCGNCVGSVIGTKQLQFDLWVCSVLF